MSSAASRTWTVAASVGVVEALKDHGICRWNQALRSAHQHLKNHAPFFSQATKLSSSSSSSAMASTRLQHDSDHSLRTVIYLTCWTPN